MPRLADAHRLPVQENLPTGRAASPEKCIFATRVSSFWSADRLLGNLRTYLVIWRTLHDADAIESAASTKTKRSVPASTGRVLDPNDPAVIEQALKDGAPQSVIDGATMPVYKMAMDWKLRCRCIRNTAHAADGLVRAAFVTDSVRRRSQNPGSNGDAGCRQSAYPGAVPANPVDRWRHSAGTGAERRWRCVTTNVRKP